MSQKHIDRKAKFQKLGAAISALKQPSYEGWKPYFGGEQEFEFHPTAVLGPDETGQRVTSRVAGGPATKTVQYHRTIKP